MIPQAIRKSGNFTLAFITLILVISGLLGQVDSEMAAKQAEHSGTSILRGDGLPPRAPNPWFHSERVFPRNEIPMQQWRRAQSQAREMREVARLEMANSKRSDSWTPRGPVNVGGRITCMVVDPTNADRVYAGCAEGGVLRSTNGGDNWTPVFDDQPSLSVGAIALDPSNPQVIYVGTGEVNPGGGSVAYGGTGVYRSNDGGDTWQWLGLEDSGSIGRIIVDPQDSDRIFVAAMGSLWAPNDQRGIFRSVDGGASWQRVHFVDSSTGCVVIIQRPDQPNILLAAMWKRMRHTEVYDYGGSTCAVWQSTDGGDSWSIVGGGLPAPGENSGRIGLSLCAGSPNRMYAIYADRTGYFDGLYRSNDGGHSWLRTYDSALDGVFSSYGWWFGNVRVHPTDPQTLFVLGLNFYRSTTGGVSYSDVGSGVHVDHHALAFGPGSDPVIYNGNDGGIYRSTNGGASWQTTGPQPTTQIYRLGLDAGNPNALYFGAQDNGTHRTLSGNITDFEHIYGGDGFQALVHPENSNHIWAQYQYGGLGYSSNGGSSFYGATNGISYTDRIAWNAPHVQDPTDPDVRYFGTQRVYRNSGNTSWDAFSSDLTGGEHQGNGGQVNGTLTTLAVSPLDGEIVWSGSDDGRVHVYRGAFSGWVDVSDGLPERWITSVRCDPFDRQSAYVTVSGFRWDEDISHVYRTSNLGSDWEAIGGNLPDVPVNEILPDPELAGHYYVATDLGVFQTVDEGQNWTMLGSDLPNVVVNTLVYQPETRTLLAGTFGRSVFAYELPSAPTAVENFTLNGSGELLAPWPNPFSGETTFSFAAGRDADLTMEVYNLAGRRIWQQNLPVMGGRTASTGWNGRDTAGRRVASGVYLVRVREGQRILGSQRIVLQK